MKLLVSDDAKNPLRDSRLTLVEAAAKVAYRSWSVVPIEQRKEKVKQFLDIWASYTDEFTELLCKENGKPVRHQKPR